MNYGEISETSPRPDAIPYSLLRSTNVYHVPDTEITETGNVQAATRSSDKHPFDNQDRFIVDNVHNFYAVFDGMGGSGLAAEAAHKQATDDISRYPGLRNLRDVDEQLRETLLESNYSVLGQPHHTGTTAVLAYLRDMGEQKILSVAHSGDSRAYLARHGTLGMLTLDHAITRSLPSRREIMRKQTLLSSTNNNDTLSADDLPLALHRNLITELIGLTSRVSVETRHLAVHPGDKILLTTDGIHDNLTTQEINTALKNESAPNYAAHLVELAISRSREEHDRAKYDDMTAVVINI